MTRAIDVTARTTDGRLLVPTVEYNIVEHCNLRCRHCDHAAPLLPERFIALEDFCRDLTRLRSAMHARELKVIGGEPLLHPDLLRFLDHGRHLDVAESITVATNGVLLHTMPAAFWRAIDCLWLSIYPNIRLPMSLEDIRACCADWDCRLQVHRMGHFRVTLLDTRTEDAARVAQVRAACTLPWQDFCHTVRDGRYYLCSPAPFLKARLAQRGLPFDGWRADSVDLDGTDLLGRVEAYLATEAPLNACAWCLGSSGPLEPHRQMRRDAAALPGR